MFLDGLNIKWINRCDLVNILKIILFKISVLQREENGLKTMRLCFVKFNIKNKHFMELNF